MRERIAASFVLLALALIVIVILMRGWAVQGFLREQEQAHQRQEAELVAAVIADRVDSGRQVDRPLLVEMVDIESRLQYSGADGSTTVVQGRAYDPSEGVISAVVEAGGGRVELSSSARQLAAISARQFSSLMMLALMMALLAGLVGWWVASRLSAPFTALAVAAGALGRGRVDVAVPDPRIPEARAIASALRASVAQLATRLARERDFAEYASHELRTPLTALQLELDDLAMRDDLPDDARAQARRCLQRVRDVDAAAGHLVGITRQGALVEGGQVTLRELATHVTQTWADRLGPERRAVTAHVDGDLEATLTPGPVEHVLELVLDEVVGGTGAVRLVLVGGADHVRAEVPAGISSVGPHPGVTAARELAEQQGGRVTGDLVERGLTILMPRR